MKRNPYRLNAKETKTFLEKLEAEKDIPLVFKQKPINMEKLLQIMAKIEEEQKTKK